MPLENITPTGHLEMVGEALADQPLVLPGVRGKLKKDIALPDGSTLRSGSLVIIQPLQAEETSAPSKFILTPYRKNLETARADLPETARNITAEKSFEVTLTEASDYLSFNNEHYRRNQEVLFPKVDSPSLFEVSQLGIPDCFLLAAIQAILNHPQGKSYIRSMMQQNPDGTTTVRLYDPETLQPEYIRVENAVIVDRFGALNNHKALWVHLLENAYAARGKKNTTAVDASISSVYTNGGQTHYALISLTGLNAINYHTVPKASPLQFQAFLGDQVYPVMDLFTNMPEVEFSQIANCFNMLPASSLNKIYDLFRAETLEEKHEALKKYFTLLKYQKNNSAIFDAALESKSSKDLQKLDANIASILEGLFKHFAAFTGNYTLDQLNAFNELNTKLKEGKLLTGATLFKGKTTGLVSEHAYTVLSVYEKEVQIKDANNTPKNITVKYVQVRNPWGDGANAGRAHEQDVNDLSVRVVKSSNATFSVELSEFCKYFQGYVVSDSANTLFFKAEEKEQAIGEINQFIDSFNLDYSASNGELIDAFSEIERQFKNLEKLELTATPHPLLRPQLTEAHTALNMVAMARINAYHPTLDYMLELTKKLQADMDQLKHHAAEFDAKTLNIMIEQFLNNVASLKERNHYLVQLDMLAKKLYRENGNQHYIDLFADITHQCDALLKPLTEARPLLKEAMQLGQTIEASAADLYQKKEISEEEKTEIMTATQFMFSGNLSRMGQKLQASNSPEKRQLGAQLTRAGMIANKIKEIFTRMGNFFSNLGKNINMFFHASNSYHLPALSASRLSSKPGPAPGL